ncbi:MAG: YHS domain-containing protein [Gammaproteobacteria bacterium]|nr:YHS domain-containing protein [Gammaproteobacteria bacterium]
MMRDPVCLMVLEPRKAAAMAEFKGYAYYFCSEGHKQSFISRPELYRDEASAMRLNVGVMGSADDDHPEVVRDQVRALGHAIGQRGFILITGACPGLPYECAVGARGGGGWSVGISPALSLDEHVHKYHSPMDMFDVLIYTGSGLMGREVTNIRSSDMVVIVGGRSGTLGEFAIAYDEGKLIGVLQGSGGITEEIPGIVASFGDKDTGARMIYEADPAVLIERLVTMYIEQHYRRPSCFCEETDTVGVGEEERSAMK